MNKIKVLISQQDLKPEIILLQWDFTNEIVLCLIKHKSN